MPGLRLPDFRLVMSECRRRIATGKSISSTMKRAAQTILGLAAEACRDNSRTPALASARRWARLDSTASASPVLAPATLTADHLLAAILQSRSTPPASSLPFPRITRLLYRAESAKV